MAPGKSVVLACLLAAAVLRGSEAWVEQGAAVYDCPDTPRMKGCAPTGCALEVRGRTSHLVCAQCLDDRAYVMVNGGTRKASCECAPGFAGKGQDGLCKRCPAGTDIAVGGPMTKSVCLKCPEGSFVNPEGTDCVCAAGHYRVVADQPAGYRKVACQPCAARNAYMAEDGHTKEACSLCKMGLVANKEHTDCVPAVNPEAAPAEGGILSAVTKRAAESPLGSLAAAFEEGRTRGQEERLMRMEGRNSSPLKALAERLRGAGSSRRADNKEVAAAADAEQDSSSSAARGEEKHEEEAQTESDSHSKTPSSAQPLPMAGLLKKLMPTKEQEPAEYEGDKELATKLIPDLAPDMTHKEEAALEKKMVEEIRKEGLPHAAAPAPAAAPSGPVSLRDLAKKVGGAFGSSGPSRGFAVGYVDPDALADAGLPPVNNVGALMGALVKSQFGDLDMDDWKGGVRSKQQP